MTSFMTGMSLTVQISEKGIKNNQEPRGKPTRYELENCFIISRQALGN